MTCKRYEDFELGRINEDEFSRHLQHCPSCKQQADEEQKLLSLARSLKEPIEAPFLWNRIEHDLRERKRRSWIRLILPERRLASVLRVAAVLVIGMIVGVHFWPRTHIIGNALLSYEALDEVEKREAAYMNAIAELERRAEPRLSVMEPDLAILYANRLAIIDRQIERCKEALAENPANAHIRKYMLAALQDKKETLTKILES